MIGYTNLLSMLYFHNVNNEYILFLDTEFDQMHLVQFAGLLFRRVEDNFYIPYRSLNTYIQYPVGGAFMRYTGITDKFLEHHGVTLLDFACQLQDDLLNGISDDILLVSHGLSTDLHVLQSSGIVIPHTKEFCTFEQGRRILHRQNCLSLEDIAIEASIYPITEHNAIADAWLTVGVFDYLKNIED